MRTDGRLLNQIRNTVLKPHFSKYAEGSCLIEMGNTHVLCTASVESTVPKWLSGSGRGWVTAEYGMLPRSTHSRMKREQVASGGRTQEISRLIGRSFRSVVNLEMLAEKSIMVDCDVIQADGGTRTASITGGFVALCIAFEKMLAAGQLKTNPVVDQLAAISVGLDGDNVLLDLNYEEDSRISTDMNFVVTGSGRFVEVQGTAEKTPFSKTQLDQMMEMALAGCSELFKIQSKVISTIFSSKSGA